MLCKLSLLVACCTFLLLSYLVCLSFAVSCSLVYIVPYIFVFVLLLVFTGLGGDIFIGLFSCLGK